MSWIGIAAIVLIAFRLTINIADSGVIDVGYAGTIGADRITHGEQLWGEGEFPDDNRFGDTYGPVNYYAYVPFELALPWSGEWDELAASHGAAIAFDLAAMLGLFFAGTRLRPGRAGRDLGILLAFAWVAYPVHGLRPAVELERLAGRRAADLVARPVRATARPRRAARPGGDDQVRAARPGAALRGRAPGPAGGRPRAERARRRLARCVRWSPSRRVRRRRRR